jgi:hypothetical protein
MLPSKVSDPGIFAIAEILRENCKVRRISFINGELSEMAASEIGKSLRFNDVCKEVHVSNCKVPDKAISGLVKYFEDNETLDSLVIKQVAANDNSGGALANLFLTDSRINSLDLSGNCLKDEGQHAIISGLRSNFRITKVSLENNDPPISPENAREIQSLLARNKTVQECIELVIDRATNFKTVQDYRLDSPSDGPYILVQKATDNGKNEAPYKTTWGKKIDAEKDYNHSIADEQDCIPQCFAGVIAGNKFNYGLADTIGRRQTMEDEILINVKFNNCPNEHVFGVFDGHGGLQCSRFVAGVFSDCLQKHREKNGNDPEKNLKETFAEIDGMCKT